MSTASTPATPTTTASETEFATSEVRTCAQSTDERAIGIDRKRSKSPPCLSRKSRKAV